VVLGRRQTGTSLILFDEELYFGGPAAVGSVIYRVPIQGGKVELIHGVPQDITRIWPTRSGLYYTDEDTHGLYRIPLDGLHHGSVTTIAAANEASLGGDAARAVWSHGGDLFMTTGTKPEKVAAGVGKVRDVVADADSICWISDERAEIACLRPPGRRSEHIADVSNSKGTRHIALAGGHVYYLQGGALKRVDRAGGAPSIVLEGHEDLVDFAVDGGDVYVALGGSGSPRDGGGATGRASGTIVRVPAGGGEACVVASPLEGLACIAVDATSLYFCGVDARGDASVLKLAKPGHG